MSEYLSSQPEPKRSDVETLHQIILKICEKGRLWFEDEKNSEGLETTLRDGMNQ